MAWLSLTLTKYFVAVGYVFGDRHCAMHTVEKVRLECGAASPLLPSPPLPSPCLLQLCPGQLPWKDGMCHEQQQR